MQLHLDHLGRITKDYPRRFYRVSKWSNDRRVADFSSQSEAQAFAIKDARETGCQYDHKVSAMNIG